MGDYSHEVDWKYMNINKCNRALGIDIGSTTAKIVFTVDNKIEYERYERHFSEALGTTLEMLKSIQTLLEEAPFTMAISGSAGLGVSEASGLPFVQEVYATGQFIQRDIPDASVVIELGGEDAKVLFFEGGTDARMNGTCAGGTGAFIDQMASLLDMSIAEMDAASLEATRLYPIASRCGVFAKTDVQALFNQGATKSDVANSIYQAVVSQTITGLAQGRSIGGKVVFLGGPLYYCKGLRRRFRETLDLTEETGYLPDCARFSVARGAAIYSAANEAISYQEMVEKLVEGSQHKTEERAHITALFNSDEEYATFHERHAQHTVASIPIEEYSGRAWLGIDSGSTTTKLVLISETKELLYSYYDVNKGSPVQIVLEQLKQIRNLCADRIEICGVATTGYGEALIKNAFRADMGLVETIAHFTAAQHFEPEVDFILDIGGQDIKCFYIKNGAIDSIMLNEACSSGCGSFLETFAHSMGFAVDEFAQVGIKSRSPVDLGSRCTVFMNSSIKQAQKDGAKIEDISAGLSISVVKNAIYKVIRAASPDDLGEHIVVQGGTLLNDAVLRAFELEMGRDVVRPAIAGLMGAFGAALYAMDNCESSSLLDLEQLDNFSHKSRSSNCKFCSNNCSLTINTFADGSRFISGNQCQRPLGVKDEKKLPNLYEWKRDYYKKMQGRPGPRGKIGIPMSLVIYEQAPLWLELFTKLGYEVVFSQLSTRETYERGQFSIPSDTICYPAKIMHGHVEELLDQGIDLIFYPSLTYNVNEKAGDNYYNCPIVAYYGETINGNMDSLAEAKFFYPYLNINGERALTRTLYSNLQEIDPTITRSELRKAVRAGFAAFEEYKEEVRQAGRDALAYAEENDHRVLVLAGRPYHVDPEISHGIDRLATSLGFVVVSEDSVCDLAEKIDTRVLNQWTYHARLYRAALFAAENENVELVQLFSFGCGVDAITSDEVRSILENRGKLYTQIKIDDISNLGAVRIRLRSLIGALEAKDGSN